ncbi:hypothetical protein ACHAWF_000654 [Thalassiosira exigua]
MGDRGRRRRTGGGAGGGALRHSILLVIRSRSPLLRLPGRDRLPPLPRHYECVHDLCGRGGAGERVQRRCHETGGVGFGQRASLPRVGGQFAAEETQLRRGVRAVLLEGGRVLPPGKRPRLPLAEVALSTLGGDGSAAGRRARRRRTGAGGQSVVDRSRRSSEANSGPAADAADVLALSLKLERVRSRLRSSEGVS